MHRPVSVDDTGGGSHYLLRQLMYMERNRNAMDLAEPRVPRETTESLTRIPELGHGGTLSRSVSLEKTKAWHLQRRGGAGSAMRCPRPPSSLLCPKGSVALQQGT